MALGAGLPTPPTAGPQVSRHRAPAEPRDDHHFPHRSLKLFGLKPDHHVMNRSEPLPNIGAVARLALPVHPETSYDGSRDSFEEAGGLEANPMALATPPAKPVEPTEARGKGAIPPLENGDRLTRAEFERRYEAMPNLKKAELIEGEVYVPSPVRQRYHGRQHLHLNFWLCAYEGGTPGVEGGDNSTVRLDLDNMPQPDSLLFIQPEHGGQVRIGEDGYIEGAPDLVAEVAASSASYDLGKKLNAYRRNGVREYVVWRVLERQIDWFVQREERFETLLPTADGILRSTVFPGLWLDPATLLNWDVNAVFAIVQQGLNSPEHADFVARLERARTV